MENRAAYSSEEDEILKQFARDISDLPPDWWPPNFSLLIVYDESTKEQSIDITASPIVFNAARGWQMLAPWIDLYRKKAWRHKRISELDIEGKLESVPKSVIEKMMR